MKKYLLLGLVAWFSGAAAYGLAQAVLVDMVGISPKFFLTVPLLTLVDFLIVYACVQLPVLLWLRRRLTGTQHLWILPAAGLSLSIAGVALVWVREQVVAAFMGAQVSFASAATFFMHSTHATLYFWFFGVAGVVIGLALAYWRRPEEEGEEVSL